MFRSKGPIKSSKIALLGCVAAVFCVLILVNTPVFAADIHPTVMIVNMSVNKTTKASGEDEDYLYIAEYDSTGTTRGYTVPRLPLTWPSSHVHQIDDIHIWSGALRDGQSVTLTISLLSENLPPWETDDLVGAVTLNMKNQNGKLISQWKIPNSTAAPQIVQANGHAVERVLFNHAKGNYRIDFALLNEKETIPVPTNNESPIKPIGVE